MIPPTSIDGTDITGATIDGTDVQEITVDGDTVFAAVPDIPQSGLVHQYIAGNISGADGDPVTNWADEKGSADLSTGDAPTLKTGANGINNNAVVRFDGINNLLTTGTTGYTTISEPYTFIIIFQYLSTSGNTRVLDGGTSTRHLFGGRFDENDWIIRQGNNVQGGSPDGLPHIATIRYDTGSGDILRIDGTQVVSGNAGDRNNNGITLGADASGSNYANVDVAEVLLYEDALTTSERDNVELALSSKYDIAL